ncbi:hypothetical protein ACOMHN_041386 [Nucella lapillus]
MLVLQITLTKGSDFTCHWTWGDGQTETTDEVSTPPGATTNRTHTYTTQGDKAFAVNCSNMVSSQAQAFTQKVQERIEGLVLGRQGQDSTQVVEVLWSVNKGSQIAWSGTFNGIVDLTVNAAKSNPGAYYWTSDPLGVLSSNQYPVNVTGSNDISSATVLATYTLTTAIAGCAISASTANTTTGTTVVYTLTLTKGSDVNLTIDYKDGSTDRKLYPGDWTGPTKTYNHAFVNGGRYTVEVSACNAAGCCSNTLEVLVLQGVGGIQMVCPDFALYTPPTVIGIWFSLPPGQSSPTEPKLWLDFDYKNAPRLDSQDLQLDHNYTQQYDVYGAYDVAATVRNTLDSKNFSQRLVIIDILQGAKIRTAFVKAPRGQPLNVTFILYRGPKAPYCNLTWDMGDASVPETTPRQGEGKNGFDVHALTYGTKANFILTVTATTPLQTVSESTQIVVLEPVLRDNLVVTPNCTLCSFGYPVTLTITWSATPSGGTGRRKRAATAVPDAVFVSSLWGDGTNMAPVSFGITAPTSQKVLLFKSQKDGIIVSTITVFNEASSVGITLQIGVYKSFKDMSIEVCVVPELPVNAPCQTGLTAGSNQFSSDQPVRVTVNTINNAVASYYEVTATLGAITEVCNRTTNPFYLPLNKSGVWTVAIKAINPLHSQTKTTTVTIVERVVGFEFTHNAAQKNAGAPKDFTIKFTLQGTDTCLMIDFGDGNKKVYADPGKTANCDLPAFSGIVPENGLTGTSVVQHTYLTQRTFSVQATAKNAYSSLTQTLAVEISGLDCSQPQVTIEKSTKNFRSPTEFCKGAYHSFRSIPKIACESFDNTKEWTVETVDPLMGTVKSSVDLTPQSVDTRTAELSLTPWTLKYDLYRVTFCMAMTNPNPLLVFRACDYTFVKVVECPLVGLVMDGGCGEIVRGQKQKLELYPLKFSYDPDVRDKTPANSGMSVKEWNCTDKDGAALTACGNLASAGTTGAAGSLSYDTGLLTAGVTYRIGVLMEKGARSVWAYVNVAVVAGSPAQVGIQCAGGSLCYQQPDGYLVPRSSAVALTCGCLNCLVGEVLSYQWAIFVYAYRWENGWRPLNELDLLNRTIGMNSKEMQIEPTLFTEFPGDSLYRVECAVLRGGVRGWAATRLSLNAPPSPGNCSITPKEMMVSAATKPLISCSGWSDDNGIAEYRFFSFFDLQSVRTQITVIKSSLGAVETNVSLPEGAWYLDYQNTVVVVVADILGAVTELTIGTVKVRPVPVAEANSFINDLKNNPKNVLKRAGAEGDTANFVEQATAALSLISSAKNQGVNTGSTQTATNLNNYDSNRNTSSTVTRELTAEENFLVESGRDDRAIVRNAILQSMCSMPNHTASNRKLILSGIVEALKAQDEVVGEAQELAMDTCEAFSRKLDSGEPMPYEERKIMTEYLLECTGAVSVAAIGLTNHPTRTEGEKAQQDPSFMDYEVENTEGAHDDTCTRKGSIKHPFSMDDALTAQQQRANCKMTRLRNKRMRAKKKAAMERIRKSFEDNNINGQEMPFISGNSRAMFSKNSRKQLKGTKNLPNSKSKCQFPDDINDLFGGSADENETVILEMVEYPSSLDQDTLLGKDIPLTSRFVSINVYNANGHVTVSNTSQPLYISIENAPNAPAAEVSYVDPKLVSWNLFQLQKTEVSAPGASLHFTLCPEDRSLQFVAVVSLGSIPDPAHGNCTKAFLLQFTTEACVTRYLDNFEVNDFQGVAYVGIRQLSEDERNMTATCSSLPNWVKGAENATQFTTKYTITIFSSTCYVLSEGDVEWSTNSCRVYEGTNRDKTVCECRHLTTFAGGWVVVPNTIDWAYVFDNLDFFKNPTLYITEIVIVLVYIVAFIWARRKDRKDVEKLGIAPLLDNDARDKYYYEIVVVTGMRRNAGTDSKVFFILSGEDDETDVREFSDSKRKIFRRGETNGFLVATPRPLGYLNYARVWHDNSGKSNMGGWYMNYMIVRDVQTDDKWVFIADRWFAVEEDDGQVDRIIPVATRENMTEFSHMFAERTRKNLADGHLWFSVVARPPASRFTCVQRVSCCLCLLYVSMLANAMFYNTGSGSSTGITIGPFSVSPEQIFIGVISNLIVFPVNFVIITLFRKSRPRKLRPSRVDEAIKTAHDGPRTEASVTDIKPEVSSIFSVSRPSSMMANPKSPRPESSLSRPGTSLSARADASLPTKKKKVRNLPWWCRIVAWVILALCTLVSAAIVTAYGITFADEMCKKWISSMLVSFFMSVFITQPIKVFMIAIFLSLIIKNPGEEEEEEEERDEEKTKLANDEIPLHDLNAGSFGAARPRKIGYKPPDRSALEAARQKRLNEIQMWSIVREVVIYSFFLWILLVISYRQRNADTFLYKDTMERVYIKNNETDIDFGKIRNVEEFFNWARSGLVNGIRAGAYYNDYPPLLLRGYVNDKVSKILGYATMRQLRIRPSLCEMDERVMPIIRECNIGYEISDQEEGTFDIGWKLITDNSTENDTAPWYRYTDADTLNGYPYWGQLEVYSGGGYVVPLKGSKATLIALMTRLETEKWIDRYSRAIFVEFTTYNAQVNLFGIASILAEFHPTGGVVQSYRFEPAMLLPYMSSAMLFQLVCEAVYCCFIVFFIVRLVRAFIKEKLAFFKGFWNLVEMGIIAMSLGAIVIYFYRLLETNKLTSQFKENNGVDYIKFQYVGYWNEIFTYMIGWTVFFATLKFLRLLRFNKRMSLLAATLKNGARSLLHFSIIFWIVFLAFSMLFFLSYMTIDIKYSSFIGSVVSGILMMMGKFDIYTMTMAEPILTQIFVFLFVVSVTFIIVNMFVSILTETFSAVREDVSKQANDYEIISFMITRFKRFTGMGAQPAATLTPEEMRNQELEQRYAEGRGNSCVDDFPERIDRLLHSISNVYMEQEHMTAMMDKRAYQHGDAVGAKGGYDNPGYVGPRSKTSELSKVHTH